MEKLTIVTTSWDDGERADLKLAELLRSRGIGATFYVPVVPFRGRPALTPTELRTLSSEGFEVGAHSVSHKLLQTLPQEEIEREVTLCKPVLEDILGKEVQMFCYPGGKHDSKVVRAVIEAGYRGARTVRMLSTRLDFSPFEMPTTVQTFPHRRFTYLRNIAKARNLRGLQTYIPYLTTMGNWVEFSKRIFDSVCQRGGVWHLYGHSWEIDDLGLWDEVKEIVDYVSQRAGVSYVPNCELLQYLPAINSRVRSS